MNEHEIKRYGLKFDTFDPEHYFLGSGILGTTEINSSGDWTNWLPQKEIQNVNNIDTLNCTTFGTLNALETLISFSLKESFNFSDRFGGIIAGASKVGNSPHTVAQAICNYGLIEEIDLAFDDTIKTIDDYYKPNPMTDKLLKKGQEFIKKYKIGHEWVYPIGQCKTIYEQKTLITQALKRSPIATSVSAWHSDGNGGYDQLWSENHWCVIYKEDETYYHIYDSYDNLIKKYDKNSKITMAKIYTVIKLIVEDKNTIFKKLFNWVASIINTEKTETTVKEVDKPIKKSDITIGLFCLQIQSFEGYYEGSRSFRNCNPGNLKWRNGMELAIGQDKDNFAIFSCYKDGFLALKNKIYNACIGKSTVYRPEDTLLQFFKKYAPSFDGNYPEKYAQYVAKKLNVEYKTFQIKDLLV